MGRTCTVCEHEERQAIDAALLARGELRKIAESYGVTVWALSRHSEKHIPPALAKAQDAREVATADALLGELLRLRDRAYTLLGKAEDAGDIKTALSGIREARETLALMGRIAGELKDGTTVNIALVQNPEWIATRTALLVALEPYPDARIAVAAALGKVGA